MTLVATDGRRLALAETAWNFRKNSNWMPSCPLRLSENSAASRMKWDRSRSGSTRNQAAFEINDTLLISKLIDGNYPNYRQVIPTDCKESIELPCGELLETVRRVSLLSVDKSTNIKLNFRENELEVASSAEGVGEARESMTITYSGRPLSIP